MTYTQVLEMKRDEALELKNEKFEREKQIDVIILAMTCGVEPTARQCEDRRHLIRNVM